jgi:hypothetical protein
VGYIFAVATGLCKKKGGKDDSYGQPEGAPVGYHNTEDSLGMTKQYWALQWRILEVTDLHERF